MVPNKEMDLVDPTNPQRQKAKCVSDAFNPLPVKPSCGPFAPQNLYTSTVDGYQGQPSNFHGRHGAGLEVRDMPPGLEAKLATTRDNIQNLLRLII